MYDERAYKKINKYIMHNTVCVLTVYYTRIYAVERRFNFTVIYDFGVYLFFRWSRFYYIIYFDRKRKLFLHGYYNHRGVLPLYYI